MNDSTRKAIEIIEKLVLSTRKEETLDCFNDIFQYIQLLEARLTKGKNELRNIINSIKRLFNFDYVEYFEDDGAWRVNAWKKTENAKTVNVKYSQDLPEN